LNLRDGKVLDEPALQADWGIRPDQVVDYLALVGDAVDNVPGIPGIGPKSASELIQQFGDLETLLASADQVKGVKKKENLREHAETARRAKRLVALKTDVALPIDWDLLKLAGHDGRQLKDLCIECGFHAFFNELEGENVETKWSAEGYKLVDDEASFARFLEALREQPRFSFDTETTGLDPTRSELVGMSFSWAEGQAYYLPVRGPLGSRVLPLDATLDQLRPILVDPNREIIGQNVKNDMLVLARHGVELSPAVTDTMVLSYLLESGERNHNLDELSKRLLDHTMIPITDLIGKGKNQRRMDQVPVPSVSEYACEDADAAWRLEQILGPRVRSEGLWDLYAELERPLIRVLAQMERVGVRIDVPLLKRLSREYAERLQDIEAQIHRIAGRPFNISSSPQLRVILFEELGLKPVKRTPKGEPSTDADVLEELASVHEMPRLIVRYRQLDKLKGTYLDALPALVHPDGRIHASFNQVVAATGRLSSSDPNLQNIPVRTEDGRQIRQAFVPGEPGWKLLAADYSQIELRVLAHFSGDPALVKAFEQDRDIHAAVAAQVFSVAEESVVSEQRRVAKMVNFGVIYGVSAYGLASRLGIPQADAAAFIEAYFQEYSGVDTFMTEVLKQAKAKQYVTTILGRRRAIQGIKNTTGRVRNLAERTAINTVIQGSAADLIKKAMLVVDERIRSAGLRARLLLQIHDELVFECPEDEVEHLALLVREGMSTALPLRVPIGVDIAMGPNWLDVESVAS
jgi:DNA polymerase-1